MLDLTKSTFLGKSAVLSKLLDSNLTTRGRINTLPTLDPKNSPKKLTFMKPKIMENNRSLSLGVSPFKPRLMECCFLSGIGNSDN